MAEFQRFWHFLNSQKTSKNDYPWESSEIRNFSDDPYFGTFPWIIDFEDFRPLFSKVITFKFIDFLSRNWSHNPAISA